MRSCQPRICCVHHSCDLYGFNIKTSIMNKLIMILLMTLSTSLVFSQSKKDLRATVLRLQSDSTSLEKKIHENTAVIASLTEEISQGNDLHKQLNIRIGELTLEQEANAGLSDSITRLNDSIYSMNVRLDSINSYSRIIHFVKAFYHSLELSDEENLRQFEHGNVKFDLENFYALVSKNARYSEGRVKNLSDERHHDKYYVKLESIVEIKFSLNKILVKTKVMYSGDRMGLFYNEEQLTLNDNKGVIKLTDWVDLDLYKMAPTIDASVDNFTREDFYKWIDGR